MPVANRAPVAAFTHGTPVRRGVPVTFTSASSDPEDRLEGQAWDLDGDGAYDDGTGIRRRRARSRTPRATRSDCASPTSTAAATSSGWPSCPQNVLPSVKRRRVPGGPLRRHARDARPPRRPTATGAIAGIAWDVDDGDRRSTTVRARRSRARSARPGSSEVRARATDDAGGVAIADGRHRGARHGDGGVLGPPAMLEPAPKVKIAADADAQGREDPSLLGEGAARRDGARHLQGHALPGAEAGRRAPGPRSACAASSGATAAGPGSRSGSRSPT